MVKLKRQRKRKKFGYGVNRKRVRKHQEKYSKFNVKVDNMTLRENWDHRVSLKENLKKMGVAADANAAVSEIKLSSHRFKVTPLDKVPSKKQSKRKEKVIEDTTVVAELRREADSQVKPPTFRFSREQVKWISNMMDTHKLDFKAMARDPKNHYQETPKAIEHKVRKFMRMPDHYVPYCRERGLLTEEVGALESTVLVESTELS